MEQQSIIKLTTAKTTLQTLPLELLEKIYHHVPLNNLHHNLRKVSTIFYYTIPKFISRELSLRLKTNPKFLNYDKEFKIDKDILFLTLTCRTPPLDIFPWQIRMEKLSTLDRLIVILVRVVTHIEMTTMKEIKDSGGDGNGDSGSGGKINRKWAWVNF
ncbi:9881_t:CDS:1 [Ambispora gerdemannii]|uniref:9881_t:CDS:1 n=1 Tax=Ambispora gerdemannii TaxID=144530 RepID=A0A9N8WA34_9GLOM|nr:9881_t:CDS:1 [Ambispora gerdemannii]